MRVMFRRFKQDRRPPGDRTDIHQEPPASLEYFCYVSRNKVDQLYEQLDPDAASEITELRKSETHISADASIGWNVLHVLSLFRIGGTYGKTGMIQREAKVKQTYMNKLAMVCLALARQHDIPPASEISVQDSDGSPWLHHAAIFRVDKPPEDLRTDCVVTLKTEIGERQLLLDCSLRNFSEGPLPDGSFMVSSANERFFRGDIALSMTTVFLMLEQDERRVVGSPLFLKLALPKSSPDPMDALIAL